MNITMYQTSFGHTLQYTRTDIASSIISLTHLQSMSSITHTKCGCHLQLNKPTGNVICQESMVHVLCYVLVQQQMNSRQAECVKNFVPEQIVHQTMSNMLMDRITDHSSLIKSNSDVLNFDN